MMNGIGIPKTSGRDKDSIISKNIALMLFSIIAYNTANSILPSSIGGVVSIIMKCIFGYGYIFAVLKINRKALNVLVLFEIVYALLFAITVIRGTASSSVLSEAAINTLIIGILLAATVYSIKNLQTLGTYMTVFGYLSVVVMSFYLVKISGGLAYIDALSTYMCIFVLFIWNDALNTKKWPKLSTIFGVYSLVFLILFGNRRTILALVLYIILTIYHNSRKSAKSKIVFGVLFLISIVFIINYNTVLKYIANELQVRGMRSYVLMTIDANTFISDKSRNAIYMFYFDLIKQKPVFGWGLMGGIREIGYHTHNAVIELILAYGYTFGIPISIVLVLATLKSILKVNTDNITDAILMIFGCQMVNYFISSGLLQQSFIFFIFVMLYYKRYIDKSANRYCQIKFATLGSARHVTLPSCRVI